MIEMAGDKGNIDIAAFTNWFTVIDRFKNGEPARVLLYLARKSIEITGTLVAAQSLPRRQSFACRLHRCVDIGSIPIGHFGDLVAIGRIAGGKVFPGSRLLPGTVDVVAKA